MVQARARGLKGLKGQDVFPKAKAGSRPATPRHAVPPTTTTRKRKIASTESEGKLEPQVEAFQVTLCVEPQVEAC
jgi:hypothetical protein